MSEAEPIPPTSSVTALRIPMIKKGEYDLWSMKMRQYIAITDHILWDIITNGDQATIDPASSSAPKTSLAANARRNKEKALNIFLSAIPDRHLLSFHDAEDAKTLWSAIKARFGEIKGSTLKQSTADPENIPKGYTQAASSKVQTAPNCASHSDEIICSFFAQQASMPTTHDDEDLLQIDEDAMEEIDIRWQSKISVMEKKIVAIEDSNSKALVATNNNEEIDWTKEFDTEPVIFAMMALTELEEE
ncbi:hypothetical protein Tco_1319348 [Tanacetum coccineum]